VLFKLPVVLVEVQNDNELLAML